MSTKIKSFLFFFLPLIILSLFVLWPSFNLHLTGDDYLGLWRYHYYLGGPGTNGSRDISEHWNNITFFLTDYGPQDTFTAIIHNFFGFQPRYYYFFSFLLRIFAAASFFPLIVFVTKNKFAAYYATLFFAVTTAGLETTDWSFNMPSYLAIALMNTFLFMYLKSREKQSTKLFLFSLLLFSLTIISQPIRMTFLPACIILLNLYLLIQKRNRRMLMTTILHISLFVGIMAFIYLSGYLGNSIGAGETLSARINGGWQKVFTNNFSALFPYLAKKQYQILTYPLAFFGSLIFPTNIINPANDMFYPVKGLFKFLLPLFAVFSLFILLLWKKRDISQIRFVIIPLVLGILWSVYVFFTFSHVFSKSHFITMVVGGYTVILVFFIFVRKYANKNIAMGIFIGFVVAFLSFSAPWLRNPTFLYDTVGRYLIVPAAGFTILLGTLLGSIKSFQNKIFCFIAFFVLLFIHIYVSFHYIYHLSTVRGIHQTETIRSSVPYVKGFNDPNRPLVFYFQPQGSEVLHHALLFGFPVIMGYQYDFFNVWHLMYTDNWDEVASAYKDGSSLKRFSIPVKKVPLQDIYSFRLDGDHLVNTTEDTRNQLKQIK